MACDPSQVNLPMAGFIRTDSRYFSGLLQFGQRTGNGTQVFADGIGQLLER